MKSCFLLLTMLSAWLTCSPVLALSVANGPPADCAQYRTSPQRTTCENARKFGLSFNAAAIVEGLAERAYAVEFCGGTPDPAEQRHTESILAGSAAFRALYDEHLTMLRQRCIYDPNGWCRSMGFARE